MRKKFALTTCLLLGILAAGVVLTDKSPDASLARSKHSKTTTPTSVFDKAGAKEIKSFDVYEEFHAWIDQYRKEENAEQRKVLRRRGILLAKKRKAALKVLIQNHPIAVFEKWLAEKDRSGLPPRIVSLLEKDVSGVGNLDVVAMVSESGSAVKNPIERSVCMNESRYEAFVYGRRKHQITQSNVPLRGIAIDNVMAVHESPVRRLQPGEITSINLPVGNPYMKDPVSGEPVTDQTIASVIGGKVYFYAQARHADHHEHEHDHYEGDQDGNGGNGGTGAPASPWTEGHKSILFIRVDFSDKAGAPISDSNAQNLIDNTCNSFFVENSYGKTSMSAVVTPVLRLPQTATYYKTGSNYYQLMTDARNAATAAGYNYLDHDLDLIGFKRIFSGWAGRAYVGSRGCWLNGSFDLRVTAHELGHNYGLWHANFWDPSTSDPIGSGTHREYGDSFDTMGSSSGSMNKHFNASYKYRLNWLTNSEVQTVTTSNTYTVQAFDQPLSTNFSAALKVSQDQYNDYWLAFRQNFPSNKWVNNGLTMHWNNTYQSNSLLLDMTPESSNGKTDCALVIGKTYSDSAAGVHITPIGKHGTNPEAVDVVVNIGSFPGNNPPSVTISADNTAPLPGDTVTLTVNATDPDDDPLVYHWAFADGSHVLNETSASKSWNTHGDYLVTCTVSDMKGGETVETYTVNVGDLVSPTIEGASTLGQTDQVIVTFSEPLEQASAETAGNYSINNGINVLSATLESDLETVTLATSPMVSGSTYTLTVNNVRDRATNPNTIAPNSQVTFNTGSQPGEVTLRAVDQFGNDVAEAEIYVRELSTWYPAGSTVQLTVGNKYRIKGKIPNISGAETWHTIENTTTAIVVDFWKATLVARDQFGSDVTDGQIRIRHHVPEYNPAGTVVTLPKGVNAQVYARIYSITGPQKYFLFTDGLAEVSPPFWTATLVARDQFGNDVFGADVRIRSYVPEYNPPGTAVTIPKGVNAQVYGRNGGVLGPRIYQVFTDGLTEVNPEFWTVPVRCRDQFDNVVPSGTFHVRNYGAQYFGDGAVVTVPKNVNLQTRSRRLSLYGSVYETLNFSEGLNELAGKFRSVEFRAVATNGTTPVPNAEIDIYNSQIPRFPNLSNSSVPYPDTIRVRVRKNNVIIADVNNIAIDASTSTIVLPTSWVDDGSGSNTAPVANNQSITVAEDGSKGIVLSATDADGDPLTFHVVSGPGNGSLSGTAPNITYSPDPDFNGSDSFTFKANDSLDDSNVATVSITVTPVNDDPKLVSNPTVNPNPADVNQAVAFQVNANDVDGDSLSYSWDFGDGAGGTGSAPSHSYTTPGLYSATVTVTDGNGGSASGTVMVSVQDGTPPTVNTTSVVLKGTVSDSSGVEVLRVNEINVQVNADGSWESEVSTPTTTTVVVIEAMDAEGNTTTKTVTISKGAVGSLDRVK